MKYDPVTRLLHSLIALGITLAMATSLVMVTPKPGRLSNLWYEVHETLGLGLLGLIAAHWLWSVGRAWRSGKPLLLFPWASRRQMAEVAADARLMVGDLARRRMPDDSDPRPLAAAFQGLGLLAGLFLAATGAIVDLGMGPDGATGPIIHAVKEAHEVAGPAMWAFLAVHPAIGVLHQLAGHRTLSRMFGRQSE